MAQLHPEEDRKNDRRRRTTLEELNDQNMRRVVIDPNQGPKSKRK